MNCPTFKTLYFIQWKNRSRKICFATDRNKKNYAYNNMFHTRIIFKNTTMSITSRFYCRVIYQANIFTLILKFS